MLDIKILDVPLSLDACYKLAVKDEAGAVAIFVGTVRNQTKAKEVISLDFESYEPMAVKEMTKIGRTVLDEMNTKAIVIHHRVGLLEVGDIAVIIAVSSGHRKEAFAACQYAIDTLKETVPIWKKEKFVDGEVWVSAHP